VGVGGCRVVTVEKEDEQGNRQLRISDGSSRLKLFNSSMDVI